MQKLSNTVYYLFLETIRDYMSIILTLIVPIMLLVLVNYNITAIPTVTFSANFDLPDFVKTSENPDAVLTLRDNILKVEIKTKDPTKISIIKATVWKITSKLKEVRPFYNVKYIKISSLDEKSHTLAGMLALSVLSSGMVTITRTLARYMDKKITKFINITPIKIQFYLSMIVNSTFITLASSFVLLTLARVLNIKYTLTLSGLLMILFSGFISALMGFAIPIIVRSRTGSVAIATLVYTILPPLSGMYFPIEFLPKYLQSFSYCLPSTWIFLLVKSALKI